MIIMLTDEIMEQEQDQVGEIGTPEKRNLSEQVIISLFVFLNNIYSRGKYCL